MEPIYHNVVFFIVLFFCWTSCVSLAFPSAVLTQREKRKKRKAKGKSVEKSSPAAESKELAGLNFSDEAIRRERIRGGLGLVIWVTALIFLDVNVGLRHKAATIQESDSSLRAMALREAQQYMRQEPIVGMAIAMINGEEEFVMGLGRRDLSSDLPPDGDTVFELASISKLFTGILLAQEVRSGALALTNLVAEQLPERVAMPDPVSRSLTFEHLATHTSGFPSRGENLKSQTGLLSLIRGRNPYLGYSQEAYWDDVRSVQLESSPGKEFRYSNFGTSLVGAILANRNRTSFEELVQERICDPLNMNDTTAVLSPDQESRRAGGYRSVMSAGPLLLGLAAEPWVVPDARVPEGGILSTANDMLKFLKANAKLDHPDLGAAMRQAQAHRYKWTDYYSLGINWFRLKFNGGILLQHEGRSTGRRSFIGIIEGQPIGMVILSNSQVPVDDLGKIIMRRILQANKEKDR